MASNKWIYYFGEGRAKDKVLLGGKGANLSEMTHLGLPIPSGFTITSAACIAYQKGKTWPNGLRAEMDKNMKQLERVTGQLFGNEKNPLLVSVRSGAAVSMPGMMDTVLNLGLNNSIVEAIARETRNPRFAYDSYRRFIQMFADVVMSVPRHNFEAIMDRAKAASGAKHDTDLTADDLKRMLPEFLATYKKHTGEDFPQDPRTQLDKSVNAVFNSWDNPRARAYRKMNDIPHDLGTAVNVQAMVFGNMGDDSATGVGFTRNPSTGENRRFGEYLMNAQGEDVVAGIRTPKDLNDMAQELPAIHKQLMDMFAMLETHYRDMQDIEFTIQKGKLFLLQTRNGKRTAPAALKMAVDMVREGVLNKKEAIMRVSPTQLESLLHKQLDPKALKSAQSITKGLPASPGAAVGQVVFNAERAVEMKAAGKPCILVRLETSPEDITGMAAAQGILTARGGMTSHAAVVARGMNVCCVAGCSDVTVDEHGGTFKIAGKVYREGDWISLDGNTGKVYVGKLPVVSPDTHGDFEEFLGWADQIRTLGVRANADTPADAKTARAFGAGGIGLTRTEHMFFDPNRILAVREMILADDTKGRQHALDKLLPYQRQDFHGILGAMTGLPVIIRLIDPPLHEFLPRETKEMEELAAAVPGLSVDDVRRKADALHEFNPMLGFRGCRLGIVYPEINAMQVRAIFEASVQLVREGKQPRPCIEIPLVGNLKEYLPLKELIKKLAKETGAEGVVKYEVGTMIEVPRAALTADEFAEHVDFMSFGTNDLTQMTCGFSRDDSGSFLKHYVDKDIYARDPFQSIDQTGVGKLMRVCVALARGVNSRVDIGICGEHGGDPASVEFCHKIGLDNVSCSPYRVPVARLAAAQAQIKYGPAKRVPALNLSSKL